MKSLLENIKRGFNLAAKQRERIEKLEADNAKLERQLRAAEAMLMMKEQDLLYTKQTYSIQTDKNAKIVEAFKAFRDALREAR